MNRYVEFTLLISKINRSITKIKNSEMDDFGLKGTHVSCLYYLYLEEGMTAKELCEKCGEDKGAISRSLEYLEENDYIACDDNKEKRYRAVLFLTNKGKEVANKVSEKINKVLESVNVCMSDSERDIFYKGLVNIADNLENITEKGVF